MNDIKEFINNYTADSEKRIRFVWNGEHAEKFSDANIYFRKEVIDYALKYPDEVSIDLIRDLFRAETEASKEAWRINKCVVPLAKMLLERGGPKYVEDYIQGKFQSFDASLACASIDISLPILKSHLEEIKARLSENPDENRKRLLTAGLDVFTKWVETKE